MCSTWDRKREEANTRLAGNRIGWRQSFWGMTVGKGCRGVTCVDTAQSVNQDVEMSRCRGQSEVAVLPCALS
jgi:hypothetical protein